LASNRYNDAYRLELMCDCRVSHSAEDCPGEAEERASDERVNAQTDLEQPVEPQRRVAAVGAPPKMSGSGR